MHERASIGRREWAGDKEDTTHSQRTVRDTRLRRPRGVRDMEDTQPDGTEQRRVHARVGHTHKGGPGGMGRAP